MKYHKLVRDKIPEKLDAKGILYSKTIADDAEYRIRLCEKLSEEVSEFISTQSSEELADILEVIDALIVHLQINKEELSQIKKEKFDSKGGFYNRIILEGDDQD